MATIQDVAKKCGLSVATVSRVLNGSDKVRPDTKKAVEKAIREMGYVPNAAARNLRTNQSRVVAVLIPNITNPFYAHVFAGINKAAEQAGYSIILIYTAGNAPKKMLTKVIKDKRADGVILLSITADDLWVDECSEKIPLVQCAEYAEGSRTAHVSVGNYEGALDAVRYLISRGKKRIGIIGARNNFVSVKEREQGWRDAMKEAGLAIDEEWKEEGDEKFSYESGVEAAKRLMKKKSRPDAVFCFGDEMARAAIVTATEMGWRVPEDLSVIGFDDIDLYTGMMHPHITSVRQPCEKIGETAFCILKELMNGKKPQKTAVRLPHSLVVRESTN